ncbi:MAG: integrin alpha [Planctomycetota bacterium]|nr:integrin alpha [Planctomycetota bacterium]
MLFSSVRPTTTRRSPVLTLAFFFATPLVAQGTLYRIDSLPTDAAQTAPSNGIGDIDADGFPDFAIGLARANDFDGMLELRSGRTGAVLGRLHGDPGAAGSFGASMGGIGDVDGDGHDDFLVGMPRQPSPFIHADRVGAARLFSGRDLRPIVSFYGDGHGDLFGAAVAGLGDVNGDGIPDLGIGAPENGDPVGNYGTGYARIYSGADFRSLRRIPGQAVGDEFGSSLAGVGDLDGDGSGEFMVGSLLEYRNGGQGSARLYAGRTFTVRHAWFAEPGTDHFGVSIGRAGDIDGDGIDDLLVGAIGMTSPIRGAIWFYSGLDGSLVQLIRGDATSGVFGLGCAAAGDVDQDGFGDVFVTEPMDSSAGAMTGALHLYSGRNGRRVWTIHGPNAGSMCGRQFGVVGDLDGDGLPECLVSVPMVARPTGHAARVDVVSTSGPVSTVGRGCATTQPPRLDATSPTLGATLTAMVSSRPVPSPGILLLGPVPDLPTPWVADCTLYVDLGSASVVSAFVTDRAGRHVAGLPIPGNAALVGARFSMQALIVATAGYQLYDVSNGVYATIVR